MRGFSIRRSIFSAIALASTIPAFAGITYVCGGGDGGISAATCNYLNSTVAGNYSSTFTNANALIYIQYGDTGLASSTGGFQNYVTYNQYATALSAQALASGNPIQIAAVAALGTYDSPGTVYGNDSVKVTSALANALGLAADVQGGGGSAIGITGPGGTSCNDPGTAGCYNGIITMSDSQGDNADFYYDNLGGAEPAADYDFYGTAEHETDEILGTASCMGTTTGTLVDNCDTVTKVKGTPSAVDLFRYDGAGDLALNSDYIGATNPATTPYFSYNGGTTNGANGFIYNRQANGDDYADFVSTCVTNPAPGGGPFSVQDAEGCPGTDAGLSILNDGGAEINILNAVGYDLTPEPGTLGMLGLGFMAFGAIAYRRRRQ